MKRGSGTSWLGVALVCCGSSFAEIPRGSHPVSGGAIPIVVDSEPPAPVIETVERAPDDACRWADGRWEWRDNEWRWEAGSWIRLVRDCYYADSSVVWVPVVNQPGALFFTPGQWYHQDSGTPCEAPPPCTGSSTDRSLDPNE